MCARFTLTTQDVGELVSLLAVDIRPHHAAMYRPRYNIVPGDLHWITRKQGGGRAQLVPAVWGDSNRGKRARTSIYSETLVNDPTPALSQALRERRCVVPADGFLAWMRTEGIGHPHWFHAPGGGLLLFAAVFDDAADGVGSDASEARACSFSLLTVPANAVVRTVTDRMPVILGADGARRWLAKPDTRLLQPVHDWQLVAVQVSSRVNSLSNDDPECLAAASQTGLARPLG